jgi:hypothetical protein
MRQVGVPKGRDEPARLPFEAHFCYGYLRVNREEFNMAHDGEYFRRRAAESRAAAFSREDGEEAEIAGHLALAYAALARREAARAADSDSKIGEEAEA